LPFFLAAWEFLLLLPLKTLLPFPGYWWQTRAMVPIRTLLSMLIIQTRIVIRVGDDYYLVASSFDAIQDCRCLLTQHDKVIF